MASQYRPVSTLEDDPNPGEQAISVAHRIAETDADDLGDNGDNDSGQPSGQQPLATKLRNNTSSSSMAVRVVGGDDGCTPREARNIIRIALPSTVIQVVVYSLWAQSTIVAGQFLGTTQVTGVTLGNLVGNLSGLSLVFGMLSAMETLAPQAYGAERYEEVGLLAQRAFILCCVALLPACLLWFFVEPVLLLAGQPAASAALAGVFLRIYMIQVPPLVGVEVLRRFCWAQGLVLFFVPILLFVAAVIHPLCLWGLVVSESHGIGFIGIPLAHVVSQYSALFLCVLYLRCRRPYDRRTWSGWRCRKAMEWRQVKAFLRLGLPGICSMSEWWFWEASAFMAGELGTASLAAHTIVYTVVPALFMVPFGVCIGISSRVGTLLAQGRVKTAKKINCWALSVAVILVVVQAVATYCLADQVLGLFSVDPEVIAQGRRIWPWVCGFLVFDGSFGAQMGTLRALGLQSRMTVAVVAILWVVGLPLMYVATFHANFAHDEALVGLWMVMPSSYVVLNGALWLAWWLKDWRQVAAKIRREEDSYDQLQNDDDDDDDDDDGNHHNGDRSSGGHDGRLGSVSAAAIRPLGEDSKHEQQDDREKDFQQTSGQRVDLARDQQSTETTSAVNLGDGEYDEEAQQRAFQAAVEEWRQAGRSTAVSD